MIFKKISLTIFLVCASLGQSILSSQQLDLLIKQANSPDIPFQAAKPAKFFPRTKPKQNWFWRHLNKIVPIGTAAGLAVIAGILFFRFRRPPAPTEAVSVENPPADQTSRHGSLSDTAAFMRASATGFGLPLPAAGAWSVAVPSGQPTTRFTGLPHRAGGVAGPNLAARPEGGGWTSHRLPPSTCGGHGSAPTQVPLPSAPPEPGTHTRERLALGSVPPGDEVALGVPVSYPLSATSHHPQADPASVPPRGVQTGVPVDPSAQCSRGGRAVDGAVASPQAATMVASQHSSRPVVPGSGSGGLTMAAPVPHVRGIDTRGHLPALPVIPGSGLVGTSPGGQTSRGSGTVVVRRASPEQLVYLPASRARGVPAHVAGLAFAAVPGFGGAPHS